MDGNAGKQFAQATLAVAFLLTAAVIHKPAPWSLCLLDALSDKAYNALHLNKDVHWQRERLKE